MESSAELVEQGAEVDVDVDGGGWLMLPRRGRLDLSGSDPQFAKVSVVAERPATDTLAVSQFSNYFRRKIRKSATPTASSNMVSFMARWYFGAGG
jgi:hypothetical protein